MWVGESGNTSLLDLFPPNSKTPPTGGAHGAARCSGRAFAFINGEARQAMHLSPNWV